jgi:hypothetical protein
MALSDGVLLIGLCAAVQVLVVQFYFVRKRKYMHDVLQDLRNGDIS